MQDVFIRVDLKLPPYEETLRVSRKNTELAFKLNHTFPMSEEYIEIKSDIDYIRGS